MKIRNIEVFQVQWAPGDTPEQRSAWVRVHCDDGVTGIGEASPVPVTPSPQWILTQALRCSGVSPGAHWT